MSDLSWLEPESPSELAVMLARGILDLYHENERLRRENAQLMKIKEDYAEHVDRSLKSSKQAASMALLAALHSTIGRPASDV